MGIYVKTVYAHGQAAEKGTLREGKISHNYFLFACNDTNVRPINAFPSLWNFIEFHVIQIIRTNTDESL